MKARIVSYCEDGELKFLTVTSCSECCYDKTDRTAVDHALCRKTDEYILDGSGPDNCPFPTLLDVLVVKEG